MTDGLFNRVTKGGFCIGCGACASRSTGSVSIQTNDLGMHEAVLKDGAAPDNFAAICPFSGASDDEDTIARDLFAGPIVQKNSDIGYYLACYAGGVLEDSFRSESSSGGLTSWVLCALFKSGEIDGVLHVGPQEGDMLFGYRISRSVEDIRAASKSRYYPIEMSKVLDDLRNESGRFAIVGVPCFIKAINLLRRNDPDIANRVAYTVGIFCGHLKSARFAEYLAKQVGVANGDISTVNFRRKYPNRPAYDYGFEARSQTGEVRDRPMSNIFGGNWGYGFFKYEACSYCDDVAAETADIAFGDAWISDFVKEPLGTNVVVVRNSRVGELLSDGANAGRIELHSLTAERVAESQAAGLRDRREGLAFRLAQLEASGAWFPKKRVAPSDNIPSRRKRIYELRQQIARTTHTAFAEARETGKEGIFEARVRPLTDAYDALYHPNILHKMCRLPGRVVMKIYRETIGRLNR